MDICPICLEELENNSIKTICNHNFHKKCFENYNLYNLNNLNNLNNLHSTN